MKEKGQIETPPNYSVANALNSAYIVISETVDRAGKPALEVCKKSSIARALLKTVVLGLNPEKNQIYYIVYGDKLTAQVGAFGTAAIVKRIEGVAAEPTACAVYDGDNLTYDLDGGFKVNLKHSQKFGNIDTSKVLGAYATINYRGKEVSEVMTLAQCRKAWEMGNAKGNSPAHNGFPDEMCKKTVIIRLCKMIINSSDDGYLYAEYMNDNMDSVQAMDVVDHEALEAKEEAKTLEIE